MKKIVLIGGGGHALSVADSIIQSGEYEIVGYTDTEKKNIPDIHFLGSDDVLKDLYKNGISCAFICTGFMGDGRLRDDLYDRLKKTGFELPVIIDKTASIASNVCISEGTYVGKNAIINSCAEIGKMVIINSGAIIEHACRIGDFSHIAVGSVLCGEVYVGDHTFIGAGSNVLQCLRIGCNCVIGMGSNVLKNIGSGQKKYGLIKDE